ncbi:unnamed protein product [Durusdinium trenchii]|uniref:Glycosyl transferase CAP10 domain-containing protein n=1 Tax=Durusdinium trenchii TaxID=1381693 RepID=A0ABP0S1Q2_9DINO
MRGNEICFEPHLNWISVRLTYEECCSEEAQKGEGVDCFGVLGGFYSRSFCCEPPIADGCDWEEILSVVEASHEVGEETFNRLVHFPVMLREFCCLVPGDQHHPCWHLYHFEPDLLPKPFVQCCFPVLRRLLGTGTTGLAGPAGPWETELQQEFGALRGKRWRSEELQVAQSEWKDGDRPCLLSIRNGSRILHHGLEECCPRGTEGNDCSYVRAVAEALFIVGSVKPWPEMDLLVSPSNQDRFQAPVPVFTRHRTRSRSGYLLLPMEWQLSPTQSRKQSVAALRKAPSTSWERRKGLFWRGTTSNCLMSCSLTLVSEGLQPWEECLQSYDCRTPLSFENFLKTPRGRLVFLSQYMEQVDARFVGQSNPVSDEFWDFLVENNLTDERANQAAAGARYALNMDGTGSGDRIYWQMLTGSLVLVQRSPWVSWLVGNADAADASALRAYEHYVPVQMDLSDLAKQMQWLDEHEEEAQRIVEKSKRWAQEFLSYDWILYFLDRAVRRYAEFHLETALAPVLDVVNAIPFT